MIKKILIIDDEPTVVELFSMILKDKGYEILSADNSDKGLQIAMEEKPALVILDLYMPKKSGFEMLVELRQSGATKDTPVLMLSGSTMDTSHKAASLGATAYLSKPVRSKDLIQKVEELIGRPA